MKYGRTAFTVGVMFTVGKYVGESIVELAEEVIKRGIRKAGQNGNKYAQDACESLGMDINNNFTDKTVIGFKAD